MKFLLQGARTRILDEEDKRNNEMYMNAQPIDTHKDYFSWGNWNQPIFHSNTLKLEIVGAREPLCIKLETSSSKV